jgi:type IV secretory pathway VirJ component
MKIAACFLLTSLLNAGGSAHASPSSTLDEERMIPALGRVHVYRPSAIHAAHGVVLFVSGDGGWNRGVVDMARRAAREAVVVGLSMPAWRKIAERAPERCWYPAGDLESIAQAVEKQLSFPRYVRPILAGYSSGATLVYGAAAQAPPGTFAGVVSLGFCPDLEVGRGLCARDAWKPSYDPKKRVSLLPVLPEARSDEGAPPPWTVLHGDVDKVCPIRETADFVAKIPGATLVELPSVGHGFSVPRNWGARFDAAIESLLEGVSPWDPLPESSRHAVPNRSPDEVGGRLAALDLPLEVEWPDEARDVLVFFSGDGGWAEIDQSVSARLVRAGVGVVGWNSLRYFWEEKATDTVRSDLARVIAALPGDVHVFAGGFSFGAEVVPVVLSRSGTGEAGALRRLEGLVLLAPGRSATFEISPPDWPGIGRVEERNRVADAIEALSDVAVLCLEPADSSGSGCPTAPRRGALTVSLPGGHHFGGDFDGVAQKIRVFLEGASTARERPRE